MDVRVSPSPLGGEVAAVASKSDAHRRIICAALADRETKIMVGALSADIIQTIRCVEALGAGSEQTERGSIMISPIPLNNSSEPAADPAILDCGESGSTLRFLLPVAAALGGGYRFTGRGRLPDRPLSPLLEEMEKHGCRFSSRKLPFTVEGRLTGGSYTLPGDISSQYISGLLFALPLTASGGSIVLTSPPESAGYIDMTVAVMEQFGIKVSRDDHLYTVDGGQKYRSPGMAEVEGDWSNAAFWLVAGALSGEVSCGSLDPDSLQGDRRIVRILASMGADISPFASGFRANRSRLRSAEIDASAIPDLVPILCVAASVAEGTTVIKNASRLRLKESDRLHAMTDCLSRIGAQVRELNDGLMITGRKALDGGMVSGYNDHRVVMAMAVAAAVCTGDIVITGAEAIDKSYPRFFEDYSRLGGKIDVINNGTEY